MMALMLDHRGWQTAAQVMVESRTPFAPIVCGLQACESIKWGENMKSLTVETMLPKAPQVRNERTNE